MTTQDALYKILDPANNQGAVEAMAIVGASEKLYNHLNEAADFALSGRSGDRDTQIEKALCQELPSSMVELVLKTVPVFDELTHTGNVALLSEDVAHSIAYISREIRAYPSVTYDI